MVSVGGLQSARIAQNERRARPDVDDIARVVLVAIIIAGRVDDGVPDLTVLRVWKREVDCLRSGVEQQ